MAGPRIFTVSELTHEIKSILEVRYARVWVEGEVSNCRPASSGHLYFTLKDVQAQLRCAMFRNARAGVRFEMQDGLAVLASGTLSVYEVRGEYQLIVDHLEPRGVGALQLAYEQLKAKLEAEGLFKPERKRPIPLLPGRVGIVTSPAGAAIRDMLKVIQRRFAPLHVIIYPVKVQGEGAAEEIAGGLKYFSGTGSVEVVIVGRGGGSIEDLWAFNEEVVARAIHRSRVPVISAVGHETDYTIADFVADVRAPTPSAAAELVVAEREKLRKEIRAFSTRMASAVENRVALARGSFEAARGRYGFRVVGDWIRQWFQRIDDLGESLERAIEAVIDDLKHRLVTADGKLENLSPLAVLARGYSLAFKLPERLIIRDARKVSPGDRVEVRVQHGEFHARVEK